MCGNCDKKVKQKTKEKKIKKARKKKTKKKETTRNNKKNNNKNHQHNFIKGHGSKESQQIKTNGLSYIALCNATVTNQSSMISHKHAYIIYVLIP